MPKLSNARRHRRQLDLASCCVNQTPRKVSEEELQDQAAQSSPESTPRSVDNNVRSDTSRSLLKRKGTSNCLSSLHCLPPMPTTPTKLPCETAKSVAQAIMMDERRTVSPAWGHFVDVILDEDHRRSPATMSPFCDAASTSWPKGRSHSPYGKAARKRLHVLPPRRLCAGQEDSLDGFILQGPASLHDTFSRLSVDV
jgi:hypothetical protein